MAYIANDGSEDQVMIEVIASVVKRFDMLDDSDAQAHGYINRHQLRLDMEQVYPGIEKSDIVTVMFFNLLPEVMDESMPEIPISE